MSAVALPRIQPKSGTEDRPLLSTFSARQSRELVIAFAGPIGCGIGSVINITGDKLRELGYVDVVRIKLSDFLEEAVKQGRIAVHPDDVRKSAKFNRYRRLQEAGKVLRHNTGNQAILAEYAIKEIRVDREKRTPTPHGQAEPAVPHQVAYLIDQVKRPEEVVLLRALYRNLFHLVGVTRTYSERRSALEDEGVRESESPDLVEIDRNEGAPAGQQLDRTLHLADYFVRNQIGGSDARRTSIDRIVRLIHGDKSLTPTPDEQGMYAAFAAGLRSACLSRQVGAAIASKSGEILATGCNDVPMAGGGLYQSNAKSDNRCVNRPERHCFNDFHKKKLQADIGAAIESTLAQQIEEESGVPAEDPIRLTERRRESILRAILQNTRLRDLIEFSRSVHAEMDAIVSLARIGSGGISGGRLYTTTFPCHSCARHIVASGITEVFYIEPYEKSLAKDLHDDAISFEFSSAESVGGKVRFVHFEGVAPRRFSQIFSASGRKDVNGKFIEMRSSPAEKGLPEYLDNYQTFEEKAVRHFMDDVEKLPPATKD